MSQDTTLDLEHALQQLDTKLHQGLLPRRLYERAKQDIENNGPQAFYRWFPTRDLFESQREAASTQLIIQEGREQELDDATQSGQLGFMTRVLVIATLPHSKPAANEFTRKNGDYTLSMVAPSEYGLPYGVIPRLLALWLSSEAVKNREPLVHLGSSQSEFMRAIGLEPRTGKRGNMDTFRKQTISLLSTQFTAFYKAHTATHQGLRITNRSIASDSLLWWAAKQPGKFDAWIELDDKFYAEILQGSIPLDLRAIAKLRDSSLALDIYTWLTYRFSTLRQPTKIPWELLQAQFGTGIQRRDRFTSWFKTQMQQVLEVYPAAHAVPGKSGLVLYPSPTHVKALRKQ